jgi:putative membrane protein
MRKIVFAAAASGMLLAGCSTMMGDGSADSRGSTAEGMPGDMTPENRTAYVEMAASSDMYEIQSSQMASSNAQNPAMRSFAQMMISDHTNTSQQLMAAASAAGLPPMTPRLLPMHADMLARLQSRTGADFDREYGRQQLMAHQQAVALHSNYAARGDTPALRVVAGAAVPIVTRHLDMVRQWPR